MKKVFFICVLLVIPSLAKGLSFDEMILDAGGKVQALYGEDLDGDGNKDLIASIVEVNGSMAQRKIAIFFADDKCKFGKDPTITIDVPKDASVIDIADLDADGKYEIILFGHTKVVSYSPTRKGFGNATVLLNQGGNVFFPDKNKLLFIDLARNWRGDGAVELMLINYGQLVIFEKKNNTYEKAESLSIEMNSLYMLVTETGDKEIDARKFGFTVNIPALDLVDYDADGDSDLYVIVDDKVDIFLQSNGHFEEKKAFHHDYKILTAKESEFFKTFTSQIKDIDGDGYGDLILHKCTLKFIWAQTQIRVYKGSKDGLSLEPDFSSDTKRLTPHAIFADADGDGNLDLATISMRISLMLAVRGLLAQKAVPVYQLFLFNEKDFYREDPDYKVDVTLIVDDFTFPTPTAHGFTAQFGHDFNGDGKPDLLAGVDGDEELGIFLGQADLLYAKKPVVTISAPSTYRTEVLDFNGDNKPDIFLWYVQPDFRQQIRVFLSQGKT